MLSGVTPVKSHVEQTRTLLEDISQVEAATTNETSLQESREVRSGFIEYNYRGVIPREVFMLNSTRGGIITFAFNQTISKAGGYYYLDLDDSSQLLKGDFIVYRDSNLQAAEFSSFENEESAIVFKYPEGDLVKVRVENIEGKLIYVQE